MIDKSLRLVCCTLSLCFVCSAALGASFDCRPYFKARVCPEIVICETPALSQQDEVMARDYQRQMKTLPTGEALSLRGEQRLWLQQRNSCGCDASCVADLYEKRLNEIAEPQMPQAEYANTFHYACRNNERRYALTVDTDQGIVTLREHGPPRTLTTFQILNEATDGECGKYGWVLNGAMFCTATQSSGFLEWKGREFDCDQADTE